MTPDLYWLTLTALATALMWVPYILDRIMVRGMLPAMGNPSPDDKPQSPWAQRAMRAHDNSVANLAILAALVIAAHLAGAANETTAAAAMIFFFTRIAYYLIYIAGIPVLRTLAFAAGWLCQVVIALAILGV